MDSLSLGHLYALLAGLAWAVAVILFQRSGERIAPPVLNVFKGVVSLVVFVPLLLLGGPDVPGTWSPRMWTLVVVSGFLGITVADTVFFMALNRLGAGMTAVVDCVYAPTMVILAIVFLGERPTVWLALGGALVLAGILVGGLTRPTPGRTRRDVVTGVALGVFGMVLLGTSVVLLKPHLGPGNFVAIMTFRVVVGTLLLLPLVLGNANHRAGLVALLTPSRLWRAAVPGSLLGGALAMLMWIAAFATIDVTPASILNQLSAIYVFVLATVFLKEPLTRRRAAAIALALGGALVVIAV